MSADGQIRACESNQAADFEQILRVMQEGPPSPCGSCGTGRALALKAATPIDVDCASSERYLAALVGIVSPTNTAGRSMRILVTGSSGFVGNALLERLRSAGHVVIGFSRHPDPDALRGDLLEPATLTSAIAAFKPDLIYHLAAQTALKGEPAHGYRANTEGTANLLRAVSGSNSVKRVVWMSSQLVNRPGRTPVSDTDYDPVDAYGASKADAERMIRAQSGGGKEWVIVRSTTIWGPGMSEHYAGVIRLIRRGLYFNVGRHPLKKSYSYIENLTGQLLSVGTASAERVHGRTFYLADSDPIDLQAWAAGFGEEFGRQVHSMPVPMAKALGVAGDVAARLRLPAPVRSSRIANMLTEYVYDTEPIDAVHGRTAIDWREGVRRTADWIKAGV